MKSKAGGETTMGSPSKFGMSSGGNNMRST